MKSFFLIVIPEVINEKQLTRPLSVLKVFLCYNSPKKSHAYIYFKLKSYCANQKPSNLFSVFERATCVGVMLQN
jgi:hypothetical protein